jgi:hypothetical protein
VAKALTRMGMPSAKDLASLQQRIAALEAQLGQARAPTVGRKTAAKKASTKKAATKKTAAKK